MLEENSQKMEKFNNYVKMQGLFWLGKGGLLRGEIMESHLEGLHRKF